MKIWTKHCISYVIRWKPHTSNMLAIILRKPLLLDKWVVLQCSSCFKTLFTPTMCLRWSSHKWTAKTYLSHLPVLVMIASQVDLCSSPFHSTVVELLQKITARSYSDKIFSCSLLRYVVKCKSRLGKQGLIVSNQFYNKSWDIVLGEVRRD